MSFHGLYFVIFALYTQYLSFKTDSSGNSTENGDVELYEVFERKEQSDDL